VSCISLAWPNYTEEAIGYGTEKPTSEDILERKLRSWLDILKETPKDKFPA
jgi:hypothetical protein